MLSLETAALTDEHRADCAGLLAERFARQRAAEPLLPEIENFAAHVPQTGIVATRGGKLVAYVGRRGEGRYRDRRFRRLRCARARSGPRLLRCCRGRMGRAPVLGRRAGVRARADRRLVPARVRLPVRVGRSPGGGGRARRVRRRDPARHARRSRDGDRVRPAPLGHALGLPRASRSSSVPRSTHCGRSGGDVWDNPELYTHFVAERDGRVVGHALLYRRPAGDLRVPEASIDLVQLATAPEARGSGVGRALAEHATTYAQLNGYSSVTDRLALGQPRRVALLAESWLPLAVPPALSRGPVERGNSADLDHDRAVLAGRACPRGRARAGGDLHRHAERRQGPPRRRRLGARDLRRRARARRGSRRRGCRRSSRRRRLRSPSSSSSAPRT